MDMKRLLLLLIMILCPTLISGCGRGREIDDMAYVVAIGVDKGEDGAYEFTFAIGNPGSINGGGGENAGSGDSNVLIFETQSGRGIFTAGDVVSARIGQEVNFSHAELLVFSEDVAAGGVSDFSDALTRNLNQRPKLIPAVAATTAKEALESINSEFEGNPEKYLKKIFESASSPVSVGIGSRNFLSRIKNIDSGSAIPRISLSERSIAVSSMSVFDGECLAGAFDDILSYKILCGKGEDISYDMENVGSLVLNQRMKPDIRVVCGEVPQIDIYISLDAAVAFMANDIDKNTLYAAAENALEQRMSALLAYSSKGVGIDIFGFDRYGRKNFITWDEWQAYNWRGKYRNAVFNLNVELKPEKTGLIRGGI